MEKWSSPELAAELGVDTRTLERWLTQRLVQDLLCAFRENGDWRFPVPAHGVIFLSGLIPVDAQAEYFLGLRTKLQQVGKHVPDSILLKALQRGLGLGNEARDKEVTALVLAVRIHRMSKRKAYKAATVNQICAIARAVAGQFGCSVPDVPQYFREYLLKNREKNREYNQPAVSRLSELGLLGPGSTASLLLGLVPIRTDREIDAEVRWLNELWPDSRSLELAFQDYDRAWQLLDLNRAATVLRLKSKIRPQDLCPLLFQDELAEHEGRHGISLSTYRRRYTLKDTNTVRRQVSRCALETTETIKCMTPYTAEDAQGLDHDDLSGMSIRSSTGYDLRNGFNEQDRQSAT